MPLFIAKTRLPSQKRLNRSRGSAAELLSLHYVRLQCRLQRRHRPIFVIRRITPTCLTLMHQLGPVSTSLADKIIHPSYPCLVMCFCYAQRKAPMRLKQRETAKREVACRHTHIHTHKYTHTHAHTHAHTHTHTHTHTHAHAHSLLLCSQQQQALCSPQGQALQPNL